MLGPALRGIAASADTGGASSKDLLGTGIREERRRDAADDASHAITPAGGAVLSRHLFDQFEQSEAVDFQTAEGGGQPRVEKASVA